MGAGLDHGVAGPSSPERAPRSKRRKLNSGELAAAGHSRDTAIDLTSDGERDTLTAHTQQPRTTKRKTSWSDVEAEKRLRQFRDHPPASFQQRLARALSQRMFVIDRQRRGTEDAPTEVFRLAGSTGNIYTVTVANMPSCTCPDNVKGNQCKHIIYVVCNVLKATGKLRYQLAYLSSELREIFEYAPNPRAAGRGKGQRKAIEGDCPICFNEFDAENDEILYCKAGCGNNVHKLCFHQWAKSRPEREPTCVYCRAPWRDDDGALRAIREALVKEQALRRSHEGYVNVAEELGLPRYRDYSSYHQPLYAMHMHEMAWDSI